MVYPLGGGGGGFVSFEFAHIAERAGSTPIITDRGRRALKSFDPDLVELLIARGAAAGISLRRSTSVTGIEKVATGYRVGVEPSASNPADYAAGNAADTPGMPLRRLR
ncbi:MAG TPA: NAD-binding protein [Cellulomonas sp.]|uniref:NAD-binding protein n=1 Tax=Cellulomonas sp. TaxID=40001 RepID=UPI002E362FD8|nr:NAD-binding protein [Cellulomonas sp.]HEX5334036.1 NAD-binding protein [Cellulomonas sp.]